MAFPSQHKSSSRFKLFHELMPTKIRQILLISTSYEAWIMEEDCRISEQIINEYRGLNLSQPPRLTWVSSMAEAEIKFSDGLFDLVIHFTRSIDDKVLAMGTKTKAIRPGIPVVLLSHQELLADSGPTMEECSRAFDRVFFWSGQAEILLAIVKSIEDEFNAVPDTNTAGVRIILFVEDSPYYLAIILPLLYKELVAETQAVIEEGLNEEHRLLSMRARPKILLAHSYEQAMQLYEQFKPYVLGVISDMRYYRDHALNDLAGFELLKHIKEDRFDIPLLLASSEPQNKSYADQVPAVFLDKNALDLQDRLKNFLIAQLGFGNFVFKMEDGTVFDQADNLYELEKKLAQIPIQSFLHHAHHNDFSRWFYTLAEVELASQVRALRDSGFTSAESHRRQLIEIIREKRIKRQRGVIVNFDRYRFDPDTNFAKTGQGSLGGKARGLAFFSSLLARNPEAFAEFENLEVTVPQTLVITTDAFDSFIALNGLHDLVHQDLPDAEVQERFQDTLFPAELLDQLQAFLQMVSYPLAVRSSSILEDAQFKS
jgi:CheY-like chemotaxis protein